MNHKLIKLYGVGEQQREEELIQLLNEGWTVVADYGGDTMPVVILCEPYISEIGK